MSGLGELAAAVDALQAVDVEALPDEVLLEQVVQVRRQIERLESACSRRIAAVHARGAATARGYVSTGAFLRDACRMAPGAARGRVQASSEVARRPAVAGPFAQGVIGVAQVKVITDTLATLPAQLQADAEPLLVRAARDLDPQALAQVGRRLRHIVDPDGQADRDARHRERRWLDVSTTFQGLVALHGLLDAETGAVLKTALDAVAKPLPDDSRTVAQRRADGLVALVGVALNSGELPAVGGERPHVSVTVELATLQGGGSRPAELGFGGPVGPATARRLSCDAAVTRIVTDHTGTGTDRPGGPDGEWSRYLQALPPPLRAPARVLDVGRTARTVNPAIRKALAVRDNGCVFPGCDRPPGWCDAHHIVHWARGGSTSLANSVLLCAYHHTFVHELRWHITLRADGTVGVRPPEHEIA